MVSYAMWFDYDMYDWQVALTQQAELSLRGKETFLEDLFSSWKYLN